MTRLLSRSNNGKVFNTFTPGRLFGAGEVGVWYDPSDLTTLYQDTAGTTPVTAAGQTVALMLDKSRGLVLGSELVSNGDFANGSTGWTLDPSWSVSGGAASTNSTGVISQAVAGAPRWLRVQFDILAISGAIAANYGQTNWLHNSQGPIYNSTGTKVSYIQINPSASSGSMQVYFQTFSAGQTATIDNISVRELPGNHATQATAASRPTYGVVPLGGRRNLLTYTEQFDNAAWAKDGLTVTQVSGAEWSLVEGTNTTRKSIQAVSIGLLNGRLSVEAKPNGRNFIAIGSTNGAGIWSVYLFNIATGTAVGGYQASGVAIPTNPTITSVGDGWYRVGVTLQTAERPVIMIGNGGDPIFEGYTGNGTSGVRIRRPQLESGSTATAYQRVVSQYDVTEAGVQSLSYLSFDGVDDRMATSIAVNFSATDKMTVFGGVRKIGAGTYASLIDLGDNPTGVAGGLSFYVNGGGANNVAIANYSVGARAEAIFSPVNTGANLVLTSQHDRGGTTGALSELSLRSNGVSVSGWQDGSASGSTGNFGSYVLYVGMRTRGDLFYNGQLYGIIVRGAATDTLSIQRTESWLNKRTGAY